MARSHPGDEYALATFASGRTTVEVPFTEDHGAHREAVSLWRAYGTTALHDAIAWLPEIGLEGRNMRRAAVLVTDGSDNASALHPNRAREAVRHAQLPVYVVAVGDAARARRPQQPPNAERTLLQLLAKRTGGRYYAAADQSAADVCQRIETELRHQYVLGFRTREATGSRDHRLDVTVRAGKNVNVLHREAYHGGAP